MKIVGEISKSVSYQGNIHSGIATRVLIEKYIEKHDNDLSSHNELLLLGIKPVSCSSEEEVAELGVRGGYRIYYVKLTITEEEEAEEEEEEDTTFKPSFSTGSGSVGGLIITDKKITTTNFYLFNFYYGSSGLAGGPETAMQIKLSEDGLFKRDISHYGEWVAEPHTDFTDWEEIYDLSTFAKTEELSAYALKTELSDYVKKEDFFGANSLNYFFANNYNNGLFGTVETKGALFCDYIFKENSMTDIEVDLSEAVSMVGGFLNSAVENVNFTNGTANLKKATSLFKGCKKLESVTGLDLVNTDSVKYLFMNCENMVGTLEIETQATDLSYMLYGCKAITSLKLKAPNATLMTGCFTNCESLNAIEISGDMDFELLFKALPTVESGTITAEISDEIKTIATEKGWSFNE